MTIKTVVKWGVRVVGVLAVLVLALLLGLRIWGSVRLTAAQKEFKQRVGPTELNSWAMTTVPDEANAAIPIRAGALGVVLSKDEASFVGELTTRPVATWKPEEATRLNGIVAKNAGALELMHRAVGLERSNFGVELKWQPELQGRAPLLSIIRSARLLVDRARLAWNLGEREEALSSVETLGAIARVCEAENTMISQLIGIAVERMAFVVVEEIVASPTASEAEIARIAAGLPNVDLRRAWVRTVAVETLTFTSAIARNEPVFRKEEMEKVDRLKVWAMRSLTAAQGFELAVQRASLVDRPAGLEDDPAAWSAVKLRWLFGSGKTMSLVEFGKGAVRYQATLAGRTLWRTAIDLRSRAAVTGVYPDSLAGLPDAAHPDALTGAPLFYQRRPDGSAVVSAPRGAEVYNSINDIKNFAPFTWELPAPAAAPRGK